MRTIAIISQQAFSLLNFRSGLILILIKSGYRVYALAPDYLESDIDAIKRLGAEPIQYSLSRTGVNPLKDVSDIFKLFLLLRTLKVDITFAFTIKPVIYGSIAAWLARIPQRVSLIEGLGYTFTRSAENLSLRRSILKKVSCFLYKVGLNLSTRVIFLNQDDINLFKAYRLVDVRKVLNIGGIGVDLQEWIPVPIVKQPTTFIFVGRLLKEKGIFEFIDAIKSIKAECLNARFIVLGGLDTNPGGLSQHQIEEWVNLGYIEWPGHSDVKFWIGKSSVFVLPSYREGVPRSTQEAMAMGRPVITTDVPGCKDTVIDGLNGFLIPPFDVYALIGALKRFIYRPELIEPMGKQSRLFAERNFDAKKKDGLLFSIIQEGQIS